MTTKKTQPRGRPRAFDVERAIDAALTLFHRRGYDAVGVAELCAELGINPPSFYSAFGSKAGLFERALERYVAGEANIFGRAHDKGGAVLETIERTLFDAARLYARRNGGAGCLVLDGTRNSTDSKACALTRTLQEASRKSIRDFIATEFPDRADALADLVTISMTGMSAAARDGASAARLRVFAEAAARTFRREVAG